MIPDVSTLAVQDYLRPNLTSIFKWEADVSTENGLIGVSCDLGDSYRRWITFDGSTICKVLNSVSIDCANIVPHQDYHLCCKNLHHNP